MKESEDIISGERKSNYLNKRTGKEKAGKQGCHSSGTRYVLNDPRDCISPDICQEHKLQRMLTSQSMP